MVNNNTKLFFYGCLFSIWIVSSPSILLSQEVDSDGDGLNDEQEEEIGTDPQDQDSDDDTFLDGEEYEAGPDCDLDGVINPLDIDSDNDSVLDSYELHEDTDGDGILNLCDKDDDGDTIWTFIENQVDISRDGIPDTNVDGDGLPNYLDRDSDNDGKDDKEEWIKDTDCDGIDDYLDKIYTPPAPEEKEYIGGGGCSAIGWIKGQGYLLILLSLPLFLFFLWRRR